MANVLVIGGNRGIGLELCRQLVARGDQVVATARSACPSLEALDIRVESVDVTDADSIQALADATKNVSFDLVICNAGILSRESLDAIDYDAIRRQFEVNTLGPLRVAESFGPRLGAGATFAIVTSRMGSLEDNTSGGRYGYRISKAGANVVGRSLAFDLKTQGVTVLLLHPGWVRTEMTGGSGHVEPADAARGLLERIDQLGIEHTGTFWHASGEPLPW